MAKETKSTSPAVVAAAVFIILAGLSYSGYTYYRYTAGIPPRGEASSDLGSGKALLLE